MDRAVVVSGGGTGIGRATARRFALAGDQVTILVRRENVLAEAAASINAEAGLRRPGAPLLGRLSVSELLRELRDEDAEDVAQLYARAYG